jgi:hypothetical protein
MYDHEIKPDVKFLLRNWFNEGNLKGEKYEKVDNDRSDWSLDAKNGEASTQVSMTSATSSYLTVRDCLLSYSPF